MKYIVVALLLQVCMACADDQTADGAFAAVLNLFLKDSEGKKIVLIKETNKHGEISHYTRTNLPTLRDDTVRSFIEANQAGNNLSEEALAHSRVIALSKLDYHKLTKRGGEEALNEAYPNAIGVFKCSHVGLSTDKTQALIHINRRSGFNDSYGAYYLLKFENGKWIVEATVMTHVS